MQAKAKTLQDQVSEMTGGEIVRMLSGNEFYVVALSGIDHIPNARCMAACEITFTTHGNSALTSMGSILPLDEIYITQEGAVDGWYKQALARICEERKTLLESVEVSDEH